jgi:hypothetical protein
MSALLRAELLKLRTTRTFAALVGTGMTLSTLVTYLIVKDGSSSVAEIHDNLLAADASGVLILLLGVIGMTGEWRHRTITSTVLASPSRVRLLAAKVLSHSVAGVVLSLVTTTTILIVANLMLSARGDETLGAAAIVDIVWRSALVASLLAPLGICVGALLRNQTLAVVGVLIAAVVIDPLLAQEAPEIARFEPLSGVPSGILSGIDWAGGQQLAPAVAVAVALAWVVATFTAGAALLRRRDLV